MEIVGFAKVGRKDVVIFRDDHGVLKTSDGFHDKKATDKRLETMEKVSGAEVNLGKIYRRMYGSRSWHPLVEELKKVMEEAE